MSVELSHESFDSDYYLDHGGATEGKRRRHSSLYKRRPFAQLVRTCVRVLLFFVVLALLFVICACVLSSEGGIAAVQLNRILRSIKRASATASVAEKHAYHDKTAEGQTFAHVVDASAYDDDDPVVSLQQACAHELDLYCPTRRTNRLQCLLLHYYTTRADNTSELWSRYSDVCLSWLEARDACVTFVRLERRNLCRSTAQNARECLRRVPPDLLPPLCVKSDYYRSVRMVGHLRRRHNAM